MKGCILFFKTECPSTLNRLQCAFMYCVLLCALWMWLPLLPYSIYRGGLESNQRYLQGTPVLTLHFGSYYLIVIKSAPFSPLSGFGWLHSQLKSESLTSAMSYRWSRNLITLRFRFYQVSFMGSVLHCLSQCIGINGPGYPVVSHQ